MRSRTFVAALAMMLAGLLIWALHFLVVYGFTAVACARGFHESELLGFGSVPLTIATATAFAALATAGTLVLSLYNLGPRPPERDAAATPHFLRWMAAAIAGLSFVAIVWEGLTAAIVPPCA